MPLHPAAGTTWFLDVQAAAIGQPEIQFRLEDQASADSAWQDLQCFVTHVEIILEKQRQETCQPTLLQILMAFTATLMLWKGQLTGPASPSAVLKSAC